MLLDAYEEALEQQPRPDHRHRIEHCSIIDLETVRRIKRVGAVPIPGTSFLYAFNKAYIQNLGWERIRYAYGMNTFYEHGIVAAASTDAPVVDTSAVIGLPDDDLGQRVHAIVEADASLDTEAVLAFLRAQLAPYKLPRRIEVVDEPLRDDAGKVRRTALRAQRL